MSMNTPTTLALTWVERGKWLQTVGLPTDRKKWDYELCLAAEAAVGTAGVYRRQGLILNTVRFHLLDAQGYPCPWPQEMRYPKGWPSVK